MSKPLKTKLVSVGRNAKANHGAVSVPVIRTSTVQFEDYKSFTDYEEGRTQPEFTYGRTGNPTAVALEEAICALEGADKTFLYPSGLAAITAAFLAFAKAGDHVLVSDCVYGPTRAFCDHELSRYGVEVEYFDPCEPIDDLLRNNTTIVFVEAPGSQTFEMQDIPAAAKAAHEKGAVVIGDNTWGAGYFMDAFALGMDVSMQSVTKYIAGHSDLCMGALCVKEEFVRPLKRHYRNMGNGPGMDECYLALRGLRTMPYRLRQHEHAALAIAEWLEDHSAVKKVYHPALASNEGYTLWKRDFTGSTGLFAFEFKEQIESEREAFVNALEHFGIGYSWGGFESLITWYKPHNLRTITKDKWNPETSLIRLHIGIEDPEDLIADLNRAMVARESN